MKSEKSKKYNCFGEIICIYDSILDLILKEKLRSIDACHILKVCNGKSKSAFGFIWRFEEDNFLRYNCDYDKVLNCYDTNNNFIDRYISANSYCKEKNIKPNGSIGKCIKNKTHKAYGFRWYFATDPKQPDKSKILNITN